MVTATERTSRLLYSIVEAAAQLSISRAKFYQLVAAGDIRVVRIGGSVRVSADELRRYVDALAN